MTRSEWVGSCDAAGETSRATPGEAYLLGNLAGRLDDLNRSLSPFLPYSRLSPRRTMFTSDLEPRRGRDEKRDYLRAVHPAVTDGWPV